MKTAEEIAKLNEGRDPGRYPIVTGEGAPNGRIGPMDIWKRAMKELDSDEIMESACQKVAEGWSLRRIAHHNKYPAISFIAWIEGDEKRMEMYKLALKVAADFHVDQVRECVDSATMEDYQLQRFKAGEHRWLASKFDRQRFGDDKTANVGVAVGNITIIHESS